MIDWGDFCAGYYPAQKSQSSCPQGIRKGNKMKKTEYIQAEATNSKVTFGKQLNGYDIAQVDDYIARLIGAYQAAYEEYTVKGIMYNELLEKSRKLEQREQNKPSDEALAKALHDSEMRARKIISDANTEAERIKAEARMEMELGKTIGLRDNRDLEYAIDTISRTIDEMKRLLMPRTFGAHVERISNPPF